MRLVFMIVALIAVCSCNNASKDKTIEDTVKAKTDTIPVQTSQQVTRESFDGKAQVSFPDSSFRVPEDIRKDYRIIGYEKPDTNSAKLILFSVFTKDVEHNPYHCTYGSYYGSNSLGEDTFIKYTGSTDRFIKTALLKNDSLLSYIYFLKSQVTFTE